MCTKREMTFETFSCFFLAVILKKKSTMKKGNDFFVRFMTSFEFFERGWEIFVQKALHSFHFTIF